MEYKKVEQKINNIVNDNVKILAQLFPSAVKDGEVDFEALKEELGEFQEVGSEKYELTWAGKQNAKKIAQEDVFGKTLKFIPEDSLYPETTENLYIEGDNLEVLKLLRQNYYGAIKMIYIDPPYNTGNDFVYNDNFVMNAIDSDIVEGNVDELGERYKANSKSQNRYHANWLNMMYPRLKVAKDILSDEGFICISIDENEIENLKEICNEIFGEENRIGIIANINNPKGRSDDKYVATAHEYILVYTKNPNNTEWYGFEPTDEKIIKRYNKVNEEGKKYREIDLRKTGENDLREDRPNLFYYFYYNENTGEYYPSRDEMVPLGYIQIKPQREDGREGNWRWGLDTAVTNLKYLTPKFMPSRKVWGIMEKDYLEGRSLVKPTSAWTFKDVNSERGSEDFINLNFDKRIFPKPKPIGTIYRLFELILGAKSDELVLDFFSGAATTAHSLFKYNADKELKNKIILVQLPELCEADSDAYNSGFKNICEIGKERIRRAGNKIQVENPEKLIDVGFKLFHISNSNIKWNKQKIDQYEQLTNETLNNTPDQMDFITNTKDIDVVYEVMLRQKNVQLSETMELLSVIGNRTYLYASSYLVCLETQITKELIDKLSELNPLPIKFIFRDSAFGDDIALKDETFRRLKALIEKNAGSNKITYTVEFI
ncbi:MAG: site-specific DNA-methyltransferase [Lachnospiraceae bacterium]|nr:site-specific DNA-methyltransferase [Lachnospiraceae bacterium]